MVHVAVPIGILFWCLLNHVRSRAVVSRTSNLTVKDHMFYGVKTLSDGRVSITTLAKQADEHKSSWKTDTGNSAATAIPNYSTDLIWTRSDEGPVHFKHAFIRQFLNELSQSLETVVDQAGAEEKRVSLTTDDYRNDIKDLKLQMERMMKHSAKADVFTKKLERKDHDYQVDTMTSPTTAATISLLQETTLLTTGKFEVSDSVVIGSPFHLSTLLDSASTGGKIAISDDLESYSPPKLLDEKRMESTSAPLLAGNRRSFMVYKDEVITAYVNQTQSNGTLSNSNVSTDLNISTILRSYDNNSQMANRTTDPVPKARKGNEQKELRLLRPLVISSAAAFVILVVMVVVLTVVFYHLNKPKFKWTLKHRKFHGLVPYLQSDYFPPGNAPSQLQGYWLKWNDSNSQAATMQMEIQERTSNRCSSVLDIDGGLSENLVSSSGRMVAF
ncbi:unnamed protein product [Soboliphyme baturini]|uniref:Conserved plasma membrane protein n=1 Tax=Soboliphyme baturini TaxID=241478 RepID=A0A183J1P4_9BILA|nr:unnamed protein product [Soboliphyme baturini]